jgi:hypothetical protein
MGLGSEIEIIFSEKAIVIPTDLKPGDQFLSFYFQWFQVDRRSHLIWAE